MNDYFAEVTNAKSDTKLCHESFSVQCSLIFCMLFMSQTMFAECKFVKGEVITNKEMLGMF